MTSVVKRSAGKKLDRATAGPTDLLKRLVSLPGSEIMNRILDMEEAERVVQTLPHADLYWLIKRIGEDDALPLLKLASNEQWQFLLDLETWDRDRLDMEQASQWLGRLFQADAERVLKWVLSEGGLFIYFYLSGKIEVQVRGKDEIFEDPSFLTLDDIYYFKVFNPEDEEFLQNLLRRISEEDYLRYQSLMLGLAGTLRDEVEEELYRLRKVRIAEDGFLPYEEAGSLYAYLKPDALQTEKSAPPVPEPGSGLPAAPLAPILHVGENNLLMEAMEQIADPLLLDRIRLEFAGLCNQILSADRVRVGDMEDLVRVCRKAAGYIHAGLERLCGGKREGCRRCLEENPLQQIFRAGFSLALEIKWDADRWVKQAWFAGQGLKPAFWDDWGRTLAGILQKRPLHYLGPSSQHPYGDFESSADLERCREILELMKALDKLLGGISARHPVEKQWTRDPLLTFHALIFNFWARQKLNLKPGVAPLSLEEVTGFFRLLRCGSEKPPFGMGGFKEIFVEDMAVHGRDMDPESMKALRRALSAVWDKFREEYAWVATADLEGRYLRFMLTSPSSPTS